MSIALSEDCLILQIQGMLWIDFENILSALPSAGGLGSNRGWGAGPNPKTSGSGWNSSGPSGATWGNTNANANAAAGNWGSLPDTSTSGARWTSGPSKAASSGGWNTRPGDSGKSGWNSESSRQGNSGWGQAPSKVSDSGWGSAHPKQDNSSGWESAPPRPPPDEGWNSRSSNAWTSQETKPSSGGMGLSAGPNKQVNTGWGSVEPQLVSQSRGSWDSRPKEPKRRGWGSSPKASVPPPQPPSQPPESLGFTKVTSLFGPSLFNELLGKQGSVPMVGTCFYAVHYIGLFM